MDYRDFDGCRRQTAGARPQATKPFMTIETLLVEMLIALGITLVLFLFAFGWFFHLGMESFYKDYLYRILCIISYKTRNYILFKISALRA